MSTSASPTAIRARKTETGVRRSKYTTRACDNCRSRKLKCDGTTGSTCEACARRRISCTWSWKVDSRRAISREGLADLNRRIEELESELRRYEQIHLRCMAEKKLSMAVLGSHGFALLQDDHSLTLSPSRTLSTPMEAMHSLPDANESCGHDLVTVKEYLCAVSHARVETGAPPSKKHGRFSPALHSNLLLPLHRSVGITSNAGILRPTGDNLDRASIPRPAVPTTPMEFRAPGGALNR